MGTLTVTDQALTDAVPVEVPVEAGAPSPQPRARIGLIPALTVFLSAFLLFQVQPLIGKYILPWFGGATGVWTTCLLFFQVMLLAGYAYAHLVVSRVSPRTQAWVHGALLLAALATLPVIPGDSWKPLDPHHPTWRILVLLAISVGLPYFALATTAPLLQAWVARTDARVAPYRLYALSNFASLLALVSYPFVIEPLLTRRHQAWVWSAMFLLFAVGCAVCAFRASRVRPTNDVLPDESTGDAPAPLEPMSVDAPPALASDERHPSDSPPTTTTPLPTVGDRSPLARRVLWVALPACATALLMGTTNTLTQDVAPVPFLWVVPLALYLLTFVLAFDHPRWYSRRVFGPLMILAAAALGWAIQQPLHGLSLGQQLVIYCGALFVACLLCHGELARLRPHPSRLTGYYLAISAGGALGGAFVSIVAPIIFTRYLEFGISAWACCALLLYIAGTDPASWLRGLRPPVAWVGLIGGMIALAYAVWAADVTEPGAVLIERTRNFYGVLRVHDSIAGRDAPLKVRSFHHGRVMHGMQVMSNEYLRRRPRTYYGPHSGLGQALARLDDRKERHIGVLGLGIGTFAGLAREGDRVRFYEIDPDVLDIAQRQFTYLKESPAKIDIIMGDGRLSLEREPPQKFDLLVLDAFSGDAVPIHLLTKEAFEIYRRHVKENGLIAVHISNRFLDLRPVVTGVANALGLKAFVISYDPGKDEFAEYPSRWAILGESDTPSVPRGDEVIWTDDSANLLSVLRRGGGKD